MPLLDSKASADVQAYAMDKAVLRLGLLEAMARVLREEFALYQEEQRLRAA